jgi:glycosyltransferase involved in cell wall biosynthesis
MNSLTKIPKISIVTPSFNQGEFLEECIDSVLSQNYPNLEYIIMDGGSTDNSVGIIKKYEKHLTYWQSQPDDGQYAAINEGFKKTTGEIMAWLNSDDKYHHHAFLKVAYIFNKFNNMEWITGRPSIWDKDGNLEEALAEFLPVFSQAKYLKKQYRDPWLQQESTFWRRSLWEKAGAEIRPNLDYAGDLELWVRFFRHAQLFTADTLLAGYRRHGNQKAMLAMDKYIEEAEKVLDKELELFRSGEISGLPPAPEPLSLPPEEVRSFIDEVFASSSVPLYRVSDDSDIVINSLLKILGESEADRAQRLKVIHSYQQQLGETEEQLHETSAKLEENENEIQGLRHQLEIIEADRAQRLEVIHNLQNKITELIAPETVVVGATVVILKKLRLYNFYVHHQPFFGRLYRILRRPFTSEPIMGQSLTTTVTDAGTGTYALKKMPLLDAFVEARTLEGETDEHALVQFYELGGEVRNLLSIGSSLNDLQALYMMSRAGARVTCVGCNNPADFTEYGITAVREGLAEWMVRAEKSSLAGYDCLFLDLTDEETLLLLKGRLGRDTKLLLVSPLPEGHPFRASLGLPDGAIGGTAIYHKPPTELTDPCAALDFSVQPLWFRNPGQPEFTKTAPSGRPWPTISIITPSFNQGAYLEETIRSVLLEGYPNLEYIVIDGGSTDDTQAVLDRYSDSLTHCISEKDNGQADALNKGFRLATGDIMAWLNSDDRYLPWTLWRVAVAFDTFGADIVAGGCALIREGEKSPFKTHHNSMPAGRVVALPLGRLLDLDGSWQMGHFFYQPEVFWGRDLWDRCGGRVDDTLFYSMDYELWVRFAASGARIVHLPDTLALFRFHETQKTSGEDLPFLPELRAVNAKLREKLAVK